VLRASFVEWAAPSGVDLTDETLWPTYMPALDRTISVETLRADMASMLLAQWARAYCKRWDVEGDDVGWEDVAWDAWQAARL